MNVLFSTTYIDKLIERILPREGHGWPIRSQAVAILASNRTSPPVVISVSNDAEHRAMQDAKEPLKAQMDAYTNHTAHIVKARTIPPSS